MGIMTGALVAGVAGSAISAGAQSSAASSASNAQVAATNAQIKAQQQALAESRALLQPYVSAGDAAMMAQMDLLGLGGYYDPYASSATQPAQVSTQPSVNTSRYETYNPWEGTGRPFAGSGVLAGIMSVINNKTVAMPAPDTGNIKYPQQTQRDPYTVDRIANDPLFLAKVRQGEEAMLQNASATGGLRGGNIQGALAQYRPQMLNQEIEQRLNRLGGIAALGQNAAAGVGNAAQYGANQISNAYGQMGAAQAGNYLAQGQATSNMVGGLTSGLTNYAMLNNLGLLGGGGGAVNWSAF